MAKVGCRIEMESEKVGVEPRGGIVTGVHGSHVQVRWDDGHESSIVPGQGAMRVVDDGTTSA